MTSRHVIVEGCDGSGKSTLVETLVTKRGMFRAAKASNSLTGPVPGLAGWVEDQEKVIDWANEHTPDRIMVYDRHPLISEPIYGPTVRGGVCSPHFIDSRWMNVHRLFLKEKTLVIWCLPSFADIQKHMTPGRDMPGVYENLRRLAMLYREAARMWAGLALLIDPLTQDPEEILGRIDGMLMR